MKRPPWKDAPEWAEWLAMDFDWAWWWYEKEPKFDKEYDEWDTDGGKFELAQDDGMGIIDSLEKRPTK